jgi:hypothetical protein
MPRCRVISPVANAAWCPENSSDTKRILRPGSGGDQSPKAIFLRNGVPHKRTKLLNKINATPNCSLRARRDPRGRGSNLEAPRPANSEAARSSPTISAPAVRSRRRPCCAAMPRRCIGGPSPSRSRGAPVPASRPPPSASTPATSSPAWPPVRPSLRHPLLRARPGREPDQNAQGSARLRPHQLPLAARQSDALHPAHRCLLAHAHVARCDLPVSGVKQPCRRNPETAEFDPIGLSPSYSPKLPKRATDVAESRNSIHVSGCETDSRID